MARKASQQRMESIFEAVRDNPGERPGFIARLPGLQRSDVNRLLPTLEEQGYLLSEDERSGLWPFKKGKS